MNWISVEDRFPECDIKVLVALDNGNVETDELIENEVWETFESEYITHWMPYPEPPKSE